MTISSAAKKHLKGLAHGLNPAVQIGKNGLTAESLLEIKAQLQSHELIKIRFQSFKDEKDELIAEIESRAQADCVGKIGHIAIFYKESKDEKKRKIIIPKKYLKGTHEPAAKRR